MIEECLLDGYNFLHNLAARGRRRALSKQAVFEKLAGFASSARLRLVVILDGVGADAEWEKCRTPFFKILYSQSVSADTAIERYLCENKNRMPIAVVTEDRMIVEMARGMGACAWTTDDFLELLEEGKREEDTLLFQRKTKAHGFNRPFGDKLKDL